MDGMFCDRCGEPATHFHEDFGNVCPACSGYWSNKFDPRGDQPEVTVSNESDYR